MKEARVAAPVPTWNKVLYSFGNVGTAIANQVVVTWVAIFYVPPGGKGLPLLIPATTLGAIFLLGRILDTFFDPAVAFYSDRCGSRRGRRMPFMLYGGLPLATSMTLIFFPPTNHVSLANTVYLAFMLAVFFFFFSFYVCPYLGLLPELARSAEDRINLSSAQGIFMLLGTVVGMVCAGLIIDAYGYRGMAVAMGAIAVLTFYLPVIGIDEKKYCVSEPSSMGIVETLLSTLKNRPFVIYLFGNLTFWFGFNIISTCVPYYVTALLKLPESQVSIFFALALGVALLGIPVINVMSKRFGKRNVMIFSLSMFLVLMPMIFLFGNPIVPIPAKTFAYIVMALCGIPLSSLFILPNAMVADLTDYDEKFTGMRREAIYFGTQGMFLKIDLGVSTFVMMRMFDMFGYSIQNPLGIRLTGFVGGFFALTGIIAFLIYPNDLNAYAEKELKKRAADRG